MTQDLPKGEGVSTSELSGKGLLSGGDRPYFRLLILVFLAVFLYALQDRFSPLLMGGTLLLLILLIERGVRFEASVAAVVVTLFGTWFLSDVASLLWPFVISFVFAFLLAPLVGVLERWFSRTLAIALIVLFVLTGLSGIGALVIPRVIREISDLADRLPQYVDVIRVLVKGLLERVQAFEYTAEIQQQLMGRLPQVGGVVASQVTSALKGLTSGLASLVNLLMIPFVTFYVLKDYEKLKSWLRSVLPRQHAESGLALFGEVDRVLGQYIRGQILVSSFIALLTATGLAILGIRYAVLLGIMAGLLNLIPYVGIAISFIAAALVSLLDTDPMLKLVKVAIVFGVVQFVEGNFLSPRVVGQRVGLHPVWVMFALVVAAHFWGFVGMIVAIPVAAVVNILLRILFDRYYKSKYYAASRG